MFEYEKWKVFKLMVRLREIADELSRTAPRSLAHDMDHLRRCVASGVTNLGEGALRKKKREKIYHYEVSRGSVGESNSILVSTRKLHPKRDLIDEGRDVADHVSILMLRLIKKVEERNE
jgi:four helix bundle protein